jgi:hypothetical protein
VGYTSHSHNIVFDAAVNAAEGVRQVAVAAAGNSQATVRNAEIAFFRSVITAGNANSVSVAHAYAALRELGVNG